MRLLKLLFPIWYMIKSIIPRILDWLLRTEDERIVMRTKVFVEQIKQQADDKGN